MSFEVNEPIINSAFREPDRHWYIHPGTDPEQREGRRPAFVFKPRNQRDEWDLSDGTLVRLAGYESAYEMTLVNLLRDRVGEWRQSAYPGVTRTSMELLRWWRRDGRQQPLFFAQVEAAETVIFLKEARADLRQGVNIARDEPSAAQREEGFTGFERIACKMATGSGKTTVMGMLAAWSILNKVTDKSDARFSDVVLVVCPNVTIRDRLRELDPSSGDASLYRTRDLVPPDLMPRLARGRVLVTNWHVFEPQEMNRVGDTGAKVVRAGVPVDVTEVIHIGEKNTTARGNRYLTLEEYQRRVASQTFFVKSEEQDESGRVKSAVVYQHRYVESETALVERVLGRTLGAKQNILVMNDEAHHAYRIRQSTEDESDDESLLGTAEDDDIVAQEATVWIEGLDKVHKTRGINFCIDLSATPYFLARAGADTARPFPWTVSDFGLIDAIESGLVKIPQLAAADTTGAERAQYFNVWDWVMGKMSAAERGRGHTGPRPEAVLKYASHPIVLLAGAWRAEFERWSKGDDRRPPVFILVCKDTRIAKTIHDWIANDVRPDGIPGLEIDELRNSDSALNTIRVDTKVVAESDTEGAKSDEVRWMRFTLDTVGRLAWPKDRQGRPIYPTGFEELAHKLGRPLDPPGGGVRCIVSVGMLTEGWDANTVTHIIGLRPFMSQLLCEQVVGRGLRRASYDVNEKGLFSEEIAQVFGVPFEVIPFKTTGGAAPPAPKRFHVRALETRTRYEIRFPRVEGYTQGVKNHVTVDWDEVPKLVLKPGEFPTMVATKSLAVDSRGRPVAAGPGRVRELSMNQYLAGKRVQTGVFQMAAALTKKYLAQHGTTVPAHVLFPQLRAIVERFVYDRVQAPKGTAFTEVFVAPYYTWATEILVQAIRPDLSAGEAAELPRLELMKPEGSTADVDLWTSKDVRPTEKSHVNYVIADTARWEQQAAFYIERHGTVEAYVKNAGLGFSVPYLHDGQMHDFLPDFIIRLRAVTDAAPRHLVLETKGYDPLDEVKEAAARRWVNAVNADGRWGRWEFRMARRMEDVPQILMDVATTPVPEHAQT